MENSKTQQRYQTYKKDPNGKFRKNTIPEKKDSLAGSNSRMDLREKHVRNLNKSVEII